jgi:integrase
LKIPKNLRPKDEQLWLVLANTERRDRFLLMLDMTEALRPNELFALRCCSLDDFNTLVLTETVYRRELRPFGKTPGSLTKVHLPDGLTNELQLWKQECKKPHPKRPHRMRSSSRTRMAALWIPTNIGSGF